VDRISSDGVHWRVLVLAVLNLRVLLSTSASQPASQPASQSVSQSVSRSVSQWVMTCRWGWNSKGETFCRCCRRLCNPPQQISRQNLTPCFVWRWNCESLRTQLSTDCSDTRQVPKYAWNSFIQNKTANMHSRGQIKGGSYIPLWDWYSLTAGNKASTDS